MKSFRINPLFLIGVWLVLTVSLAVWWLIYGLNQIEKIMEVSSAASITIPDYVLRGHRMLHWEGGTLIGLLLVGGVTLFYYSLRENFRNKQVKEFFATLTHELKTPLASLRLQVESLSEDLAGSEHSTLVQRLLGDSTRLELQLENALFLAGVKDVRQLHTEKLFISQILQNLTSNAPANWPKVKNEIPAEVFMRADRRAFEGILKNIVQNAAVHGLAKNLKVYFEKKSPGEVKLIFTDDGVGFKGNFAKLAHPFFRHTASSGSGVGLYLSKTLVQKMHGALEFDSNAKTGFTVKLTLRGGLADGETA